MMKKLVATLLFLGFFKAFSQPYSTAPSYSLQSTRSGEKRLQWVNNATGIAWDPYTIFLTAQQANLLFKPIGYTPSNAEILAAIGYPPYNAVTNPKGFITANYLGFDNRYLQLGSLNGYATQTYVNTQGFIKTPNTDTWQTTLDRNSVTTTNPTVITSRPLDNIAYYANGLTTKVSTADYDAGVRPGIGFDVPGRLGILLYANGRKDFRFLSDSLQSGHIYTSFDWRVDSLPTSKATVQRTYGGDIMVNYVRSTAVTQSDQTVNGIFGSSTDDILTSKPIRKYTADPVKKFLNINDGSSLNNDISGSALKWGGLQYNNNMATIPTNYFYGYNFSDDSAHPYPISLVKQSLGYGTAADRSATDFLLLHGTADNSLAWNGLGYNNSSLATTTNFLYGYANDGFAHPFNITGVKSSLEGINANWHITADNAVISAKSIEFQNSAAFGITLALINSWNTAYGWGNHAGLYYPVTNPNNYLNQSGVRASFTAGVNISIDQTTGVISGKNIGGTSGFNFDVTADTGAQLTANNTITFPHHLIGYSAGSVIVGNCYDIGTAWALSYSNCKMDATNITIAFRSAVDLNSVMSFGFQITK